MSRCRSAVSKLLLLLCAFVVPHLQADQATGWTEGNFSIRDFRFRSGESLPELRLHYLTRGTPHRNAVGQIDNAVMILHGTGGSGRQFLQPQFADELFVPGGLLDPARYFIVLPDGIGHGKSSKPSDGLRARFPHYDYDDMVAVQYRLLTEGLGVDRLRLLLGTSMGCMHAFVWGETYPDAVDALMPLACLPAPIAGRNRVWRKLVMDAITLDPAWQGGNYREQPLSGLRAAQSLLLVAGSAPLFMQSQLPDREAADAWAVKTMAERLPLLDANDLLYQVAASRNYDPLARLGEIRARVMWVNSADDFINPPELGIAEAVAPRLQRGRFVLLPVSPFTRGHGSHTWAVLWKTYLADVLAAGR